MAEPIQNWIWPRCTSKTETRLIYDIGGNPYATYR